MMLSPFLTHNLLEVIAFCVHILPETGLRRKENRGSRVKGSVVARTGFEPVLPA